MVGREQTLTSLKVFGICAGGDFTECWTPALSIQDLDQNLMHLLMEINALMFIIIIIISFMLFLSTKSESP